MMVNHEIKRRDAWKYAWWFGYIFVVGFSTKVIDRRDAEAWFWLFFAGGIALLIATLVFGRPTKHLRETLLREAEARLSRHHFISARVKLEDAKRRLLEIHENPWLFISEAAAARQVRQREQLLNASTLSAPRVPKLTASERAALVSLGIVSAADVLRKRSQLHHALSYAMVREIIQWAESCGSEAVADTVTPLEAQELRAVDEALRAEARRLMTEMRSGTGMLRNAGDNVRTARRVALIESSRAES